MSSVWHINCMTLSTGAEVPPSYPANLPKVQTEFGSLCVNTHRAVPSLLSLPFSARALLKPAESVLHMLARWFGARHVFSLFFFQIGCVHWHNRSGLDQSSRKGDPYVSTTCGLGRTSDFAAAEFHTELVWTPLGR